MLPILILNDLHLGVNRASGTTLKSAYSLRQYLLASFSDLIHEHVDKSILINGDTFDDYMIPLSDVSAFIGIVDSWLSQSGGVLYVVAGNHDLSKNSANVGALEMAVGILARMYPDRVQPLVREPMQLQANVYVIPHLPNQELFDAALEQVPADYTGYVLLHANFANNFTVHSDHSLNVSRTQAKKLIEQGCRLIFGHEHQHRTAFAGKLIVTGNQFPSSVSDCLPAGGQEDGLKFAHVLYEDGQLEAIGTWDAAQDFTDLLWDSIDLYDKPYRFVRVEGHATAERAADVIQQISKLRQRSDAFVITNAVKIEGMTDETDLPESLEVAKAFDVLAFLFEQLTEEEQVVVSGLMEESNA